MAEHSQTAVTERRYGGRTVDERRADRRARLRDTGLEVFGTTGFQRATIEQVCATAKVATRNFAGLSSEMRKYNVSLPLACQHLSQLDRRMRDALLGNCGTITAFRIGPRNLRPGRVPLTRISSLLE